jgi:hypothetical protein
MQNFCFCIIIVVWFAECEREEKRIRRVGEAERKDKEGIRIETDWDRKQADFYLKFETNIFVNVSK